MEGKAMGDAEIKLTSSYGDDWERILKEMWPELRAEVRMRNATALKEFRRIRIGRLAIIWRRNPKAVWRRLYRKAGYRTRWWQFWRKRPGEPTHTMW